MRETDALKNFILHTAKIFQRCCRNYSHEIRAAKNSYDLAAGPFLSLSLFIFASDFVAISTASQNKGERERK